VKKCTIYYTRSISLNSPSYGSTILREQPENAQVLSLKAYALNKLANLIKDWEYSRSALAAAEKALELSPLNDIALTSKGWALIDLGRPSESIPYLIRATTANPRNKYA